MAALLLASAPAPAAPQAPADDTGPTQRVAPVRGAAAERLKERSRPPGSEPVVFLETELDPPQPYVGQQAIYTVWLYTRHRVSQLQLRALPRFTGWWVREVPAPSGLASQSVRRDGLPYWRAAVLRRALFALRDGPAALEPARFKLVVEVPMRDSAERLLQRPVPLEASSATAAVRVRPLPPPPPEFAAFTGAVGTLAVETQLDPEQVLPGEVALWTVTVRGTANLFPLPAPAAAGETPGAAAWPAGLTALEPEEESDEKLAGDRLIATRSWRYPVFARRVGSWELPAVAIPYFDPGQGRYRTAVAPPRRLTVRTLGPDPAATGGLDTAADTTAGTAAGTPSDDGAGDVGRWLLLAGALALATGLVLLLARRRGRRGDQRLLAALDQAGREERPERIAARVEEAWSDYLERRWGITEPATRWHSALVQLGVRGPLAGELDRLAGELAALRSGPRLAPRDEPARELLAAARSLARRRTGR
jgi:hypothetical protein